MKKDYIFLDNLSLFLRIGVTDSERETPQKVVLALKIYLDLKKSAQSDNIKDTLDYGNLYKLITALAKEKEWYLLESFAFDISALIKKDKRVKTLEIKVDKFVLPEECISGVFMVF